MLGGIALCYSDTRSRTVYKRAARLLRTDMKRQTLLAVRPSR